MQKENDDLPIHNLEYYQLFNILKGEHIFCQVNFETTSIENIGNKLLPKAIDGETIDYLVWPQYWKQLKNEFKLLLCTCSKKYQPLRNSLRLAAKKSQTTIVSTIAAAMAVQFGVTAGVLVPFCALLLIALVKLGKESFCSTISLDILVVNKKN